MTAESVEKWFFKEIGVTQDQLRLMERLLTSQSLEGFTATVDIIGSVELEAKPTTDGDVRDLASLREHLDNIGLSHYTKHGPSAPKESEDYLGSIVYSFENNVIDLNVLRRGEPGSAPHML